jgi:hypothetical protein
MAGREGLLGVRQDEMAQQRPGYFKPSLSSPVHAARPGSYGRR